MHLDGRARVTFSGCEDVSQIHSIFIFSLRLTIPIWIAYLYNWKSRELLCAPQAAGWTCEPRGPLIYKDGVTRRRFGTISQTKHRGNSQGLGV